MDGQLGRGHVDRGQLGRGRAPLVIGLLGVLMIAGGFHIVNNTEVRCDGRPMTTDDECLRRFTEQTRIGTESRRPSGPRYEYVTTYTQERFIQRWPGGLLLATGGMFVLGGWRLSRRYARAAEAREQHARQRAEVAAARGWAYRRRDPSVVHAWQHHRLLGEPPVAQDVISGVINGIAFTLFDVEHAVPETMDALGGVRRFTVCAVPLGFPPPTLQVIVSREHLAHLRVLSPSPTDEGNLAVPGGRFGWAASVRALMTSEAAVQRLLTAAVVAHVRAHQLSFVLLGRWLSVTVPRVEDPAAIAPLVSASTALAALIPIDPDAGPRPDEVPPGGGDGLPC
jgi:hypothetical protein